MPFENVFWIGHASFYIKYKGATVFIDPFRVSDKIAKSEKADLILITHAHFDHFSINDIKKVKKDSTLIITSTKTMDESKNVKIAKPGFVYELGGIKIEAVPAYNIAKERLSFHPKSNEWVGYIISAEGLRIYHAGDTDFIPEMHNFANIDLALLPIGGTYTMDVEEASNAIKAIKPKFAAPMHYKNLLGKEGSKAAEEKFKNLVGNALIFKEVQEPTYSF